MVRPQAVLLAMAGLAVLLLASRPTLALWTLAGAAAGAAIGLLLAIVTVVWERRPAVPVERLAWERRSTASGYGRVIAIALCVAGVTVAFVDAVVERSEVDVSSPAHRVPARGHVDEVIGIHYAGSFRYERATRSWRGHEAMRLTESDRRLVAARRDGTPEMLLRPEWSFQGWRGGGRVQMYVRERAIAAPEPDWLGQPVEVRTVAIPPIELHRGRVVLVPRDGSSIVFRAPKNLVRATDPAGRHRDFGDQTIVTVALKGLEDDPSRRQVGLEMANALGRSTAFGVVATVSAWKVLAWLFAGVPLLVVAHFVNRYLQHRWPVRPEV